MDMQRLFDMISDTSRQTRSDYHLTLGRAIKILEEVAPSTSATLDIVGTPGRVRSYRGYYSDLAFTPELEPTTAGEVLADLKRALGSTFQGYKGGDFGMGADTPLWLASYGDASGIAVTAIEVREGRAVFCTKRLDR